MNKSLSSKPNFTISNRQVISIVKNIICSWIKLLQNDILILDKQNEQNLIYIKIEGTETRKRIIVWYFLVLFYFIHYYNNFSCTNILLKSLPRPSMWFPKVVDSVLQILRSGLSNPFQNQFSVAFSNEYLCNVYLTYHNNILNCIVKIQSHFALQITIMRIIGKLFLYHLVINWNHSRFV